MKITTKYLQKLIKEEIANVFNEQHRSHGRYPGSEDWGSPDDPRIDRLAGGFSYDERHPESSYGAETGYGAMESEGPTRTNEKILTMDIRHLLDVFREECPTSVTGSGWTQEQCQLARERIQSELGPTYE